MYETIKTAIIDLSAMGINVFSVISTLFLVDFIKNKLDNFTFYNDKTKSIINIILGLIISVIIAILFSLDKLKINDIIKTSIVSIAFSVYSREIMDAIRKFFKRDKNV